MNILPHPLRQTIVTLLAIAGLIVGGGTYLFPKAGIWLIPFAWLAGAGALGFLTGYVTATSRETGPKEFLMFVSTGVIVPLAGGVVSLLQRTQKTVDVYSYEGTQVAMKTTTITFESAVAAYHPISMLGLFLAAFGVLAVMGIIVGSGHRNNHQVEIATRLH